MKRSSTPCATTSYVAAALFVWCTVAIAQPYDVQWNTVDGGGTMNSTGNMFKLSGTVGQHDASTPMSGAKYALVGGFWSGSAEEIAGDADADPNDPSAPPDDDGPKGNGGDPANSSGNGGNSGGGSGGEPPPQSQPADRGAPDCGAGVCGAGSAMPLMITCLVTPLLRRRRHTPTGA